MRTFYHIIILLAVCVFLFLFGLGNMALTDPDETFYAQTASEMFETNEWVTPMIFGKPQFEKPVLYYWLILLSYKAFGISEFSARLPSVVFAMGGIIGIYLIGRVIFSPLCGFLSGLIMATSVLYLVLARGCVTDMVLTVFIIFCFLFFILAWITRKRSYYLLSAVMAGLAVLTKGPIGLIIPGAVIGLYVITGGRWRSLKDVPIALSILVFLAVSLPWYVLVAKMHGATFIDEFFGFHNVVRFMEPEHRIGSSPFYNIPVIMVGFFPWSAFLPLGAWFLYRKDDLVSRLDAHRLFLGLWVLTIFLFFSVSRTKLATYIFPLFPAIAIITGRFWESFIRDAGKGRKAAVTGLMDLSYYLYLFLGIASLAGVFFVVKYRYPQAINPVVLCETVFALGTILSVVFFWARKRLFLFSTITLTAVLMVIPLVTLVLPIIEPFESSKVLAHKFKELAKDTEPVGGECDHRRGIAFYTDRTEIEDIHPYHKLLEFISREERVWGIIQVKHYNQVKESREDLYMEPVFEVGKYVLITNKPYERQLQK